MKKLFRFLFLSVAILAAGAASAQQSWAPGKTIRIINPYPPGGSSDIIARAIAAVLTNSLGQSVVVENKPGASTLIATNELRNSPPDGTSIFYTTTTTTSVLPQLYAKAPFDPFKDVAPLGIIAYNKLVVTTRKDAPFNTMAELVEYARKNPGKLNYASFGTGSLPHLLTESLAKQQGVKMVHVPYKGGAEAGRAVMAGEADILIDAALNGAINASGGRVKLLAVVGPSRIKSMPDVPTMAEAGFPGFSEPGLEQVLAPAGIPPAIADQINAALMQAARDPKVRAVLDQGGYEPVYSNRKEHEKIMKSSYDYWGKIITQTGIRLD